MFDLVEKKEISVITVVEGKVSSTTKSWLAITTSLQLLSELSGAKEKQQNLVLYGHHANVAMQDIFGHE